MPDAPSRPRVKPADLVSFCDSIAEGFHKGIKRPGTDLDYITHPRAVANLIMMWAPFESLDMIWAVCAALLHDTTEDTDATAEWLLAIGVPQEVVDAVLILSRDPKNETYFDFILRVIASGNQIAIAVKLADLHHNMSNHKEDSRLDKYRFAAYLLEQHTTTRIPKAA